MVARQPQCMYACMYVCTASVHVSAFVISQACSEDVLKVSRVKLDSYRFISDLMDVFSLAGVQQQAEQPTYLAEGQTLL